VALVVAAGPEESATRRWGLLLALGFVGSSLPHYGFRFVGGWTTFLAYPRLFVLLALFVAIAWPIFSRRSLAAAAAIGLAAAGPIVSGPAEEPWERLTHGYSAGRPIDCADERGWITVRGVRAIGETSRGRHLEGPWPAISLQCVGSELTAGPLRPAPDEDATPQVRVVADRAAGILLVSQSGGPAATLAPGRFRHPRLHPDGRFVVVESWERDSWDIRAFDLASGAGRVVAGGPSNERDPAWSADGTSVLFASDRRRGLGSTVVYRVPFRGLE
jgi:hypothetical protein